MKEKIKEKGKGLLTGVVSIALVFTVLFTFESLPVSAVTDDVVVNQTVTTGIAISSPSDITMTALSTTQNTAVGSAAWTVTTNNAAGYTLTLFASSAPAMARSGGGGNIADYTPGTPETPETWSVASGAVEFGFSAFGSHVPTGTWGTDADCIAAADVPSATLNWRDFDLTGSADQIATSASATSTSGTASTMCVATEQDTLFAASGTYSATITATATATP
jgi:hypothetical protein